jgi:hypothetical protein
VQHGGLFRNLQRIVCCGGPVRWLVAATQVFAIPDADLKVLMRGCNL